jgi:hypothetical protein
MPTAQLLVDCVGRVRPHADRPVLLMPEQATQPHHDTRRRGGRLAPFRGDSRLKTRRQSEPDLSHSLSVAEMCHRIKNLIVGCPTEDDSVILPSFHWCFARSAADAVPDVAGWGAR